MDYKEKYKEALERAKYALTTDMDNSGHWAVNYIFPELKESEDERIRKELIEFIKSRGGFKQEYIAWLEKQGEQHSPIDINKAELPFRRLCMVDEMVDEFAHTEVKGYGIPSMIEVDAYRKGIEDTQRRQGVASALKMLNADKVIEWLDNNQPSVKLVAQFKHDFDL